MKESRWLKFMKKVNYSAGLLWEHKIFIAVLFILSLAFYFSYAREGILYHLITNDTGSVINFINSFGVLSFVVYFILVVMEVVMAPIPSLVLYAAGGIIFGTFLGGTLALLGNILGAVIAFKIANRYGRKYVEGELRSDKLELFDKFSKKYGGYAIFLLRINPLTSSDIFSYLAGLTKMPLKNLVLGTALGLAPLAYAQSYLGGYIVKNNPFLYMILFFICVAYFLLFFYGIYYAKMKRISPKQKKR
jgi:uncharacterized membrane protein YdjX (TVP38/TMEM64 family)